MWKVYPTGWRIPPGFEPDLSRFIIVDCPTKEDALERAFQRMATGLGVWQITGPNGFVMDCEALVHAYLTKIGK